MLVWCGRGVCSGGRCYSAVALRSDDGTVSGTLSGDRWSPLLVVVDRSWRLVVAASLSCYCWLGVVHLVWSVIEGPVPVGGLK